MIPAEIKNSPSIDDFKESIITNITNISERLDAYMVVCKLKVTHLYSVCVSVKVIVHLWANNHNYTIYLLAGRKDNDE